MENPQEAIAYTVKIHENLKTRVDLKGCIFYCQLNHVDLPVGVSSKIPAKADSGISFQRNQVQVKVNHQVRSFSSATLRDAPRELSVKAEVALKTGT